MARAAWFFRAPDDGELPDRVQGLFAKARERIGFVPNVFRSYSIRPERFSAWFAHFKLLHEPTEHLDEADREMIAVVVSAYNRCTYCIVAHGQALRAGFRARGLDLDAIDITEERMRFAGHGIEPRRAGFGLAERHLLAVVIHRRVIGAHEIDRAIHQPCPQCIAVTGTPQRRHQPAQQLDRRVGRDVHQFQPDGRDADRAP